MAIFQSPYCYGLYAPIRINGRNKPYLAFPDPSFSLFKVRNLTQSQKLMFPAATKSLAGAVRSKIQRGRQVFRRDALAVKSELSHY